MIASNRGAQSQRLPVIKPTGRQALNRRVVFDGQTFRVAARPVAGAPWQLVVTVPEAGLYAPLSAVGRGLAWGGLAIFVLASLLIAGLVGRLLTARTRLTGDIATREQVEHKLRDAQARLYQVFAEAPIGMALVDLDGAWRQVNQALCTMLRYSEPELLRCTREQVTHPTTSSLTAKELRLLEITAGAPTVKGKRTGVWATRERMRQAERELAQQAEASYTRTVRDWQATRPAKAAGPAKVGASVTPGHA